MQPIILQGRPAYSNFRQQALLHDLNKAEEAHEIGAIDAVEVFFIETVGPLDDFTTERAFSLLGAERHFDREAGFFVTPEKAPSPLGPPRPPISLKTADSNQSSALSEASTTDSIQPTGWCPAFIR